MLSMGSRPSCAPERERQGWFVRSFVMRERVLDAELATGELERDAKVTRVERVAAARCAQREFASVAQSAERVRSVSFARLAARERGRRARALMRGTLRS